MKKFSMEQEQLVGRMDRFRQKYAILREYIEGAKFRKLKRFDEKCVLDDEVTFVRKKTAESLVRKGYAIYGVVRELGGDEWHQAIMLTHSAYSNYWKNYS